MNEQAMLIVLKIVSFVGMAVLFVCTALLFGGVAYIWVDTYFGAVPGLLAGLLMDIATGTFALLALRALVRWLFPALWR